MNNEPINVLLIEDNPGDVLLMREMLAKARGVPFRLEHADRLSTGLECLVAGGVDVLLLDLGLPDSQGFGTFARAHAQAHQMPIIVLTGLDDGDVAVQAVREGAQDYLVKGQVDGHLLVRVIRYAIERKRAEKALQESQRSLEAVVETAPSLIVLTDPDGRILLFNCACEELTGYRREEVIGKTIPELFLPPEWIAIVQKRFADPYAPEVRAAHENPWITKSGEERLIEWRCTVLPSPEDGRPCVLGIGVDITERKRAEEALRASEERFRSILDNIEDGYYEVDTAGNFTFFNPALVRMLGRPANQVMGMNNRLYMTPEGATAVFQTFNRVFRTGIPEQALDWDLVRPDGTRRSIEVSVSLIKAADGSIKGFRGTVHDITERKRAEEALRESQERFQAFMQNFPGLAYMKDSDGRVVFANQGFAHYLGLNPADMPGKTNYDLFPAEFAERITADDRGVLEVGGNQTVEEEFAGRAWTTYKFPISQPGAPPLLGGLTVDITERKRAEAMIRKQLDELRRWHDLTLDREDRVLELKGEVNELLRRLGEPIRYASAEP